MGESKISPQSWRFTLPFLPPGVNHQYTPIGTQGQKALTAEARAIRGSITVLAHLSGFTPNLDALYGVRVIFTMPGWSGDIDGPIKALLDSVFVLPGHRTAWDHRIVHLEVEKRVEPGVRQTDVRIWEIAEPEEAQ